LFSFGSESWEGHSKIYLNSKFSPVLGGCISWLFFFPFEVNVASCVSSHMETRLVDKAIYPDATFVLSYFYPRTVNFSATP